ncbi:VOC family protein [Streptomyces sp. NPDC057199]|uniref:VOC family protein n=1 Tax=Streptomyces sp. NPDC057199 TaxID=3346047 RepID=UPI003627B1B8
MAAPTGDPRPWLDHVAFAVPDLMAPAVLILDGLGGEFVRGGDSPKYGYRTAQFKLRGGVKLELLTPLDDASELHGFLDRRGAGVHHVTFMCEDVEAMDARLRLCGLRTVDLDLSEPNWRETYLGPRQGLGTVLQFGDAVIDWTAPAPGFSFTDVLDGLVEWDQAAQMIRRG